MINTGKNKEDAIFKELASKYPYLKKYVIQKINWRIFKYLALFCENRAVLAASLIQNPFGKTPDLNKLKKYFGAEVFEVLTTLNYIQTSSLKNTQVFKNYNHWKSILILYLANYAIIFENNKAPKNNRAKHPFDRKKIKFALKVLENLDISDIRSRLEDIFFAIIEPDIYKSYDSLLKFTRKKYLFYQNKIIQEFQRMLKKAKIKSIIESRLKTIYSIHHKILKKSILLSQVLDTIGLRIIVDNEEDCYRSMVLILKKSPIMTSMVKDYIAIPKENGYQSIHLTIFYEGHPVEIQIRTHAVHKFAQFGPASHFEYKKNKR